MALTATPPTRLKRLYPHVEDIQDWRAQQTIRLLWDRIFNLESRLQATESTTGDLVSATNRQDDELVRVSGKADEALARAQLSRSEQSDIEEGSHLPGEAPDMFSVVESTYAAAPPAGGTWNLAVIYGPTGASKFVEAVVTTLHGTDARWGHLNKTGGQTGSVDVGGDGHAVDAIDWKNPDGVTAEIYDIVSSSGGIQWNYDTGSRDNDNALTNWKYPA